MIKSIQQRSNVSAYVILKGTRKVATVQVLYPKDGAGRLHVEVHTWGKDGGYTEYKGSASGWGYDKVVSALAGLVIDGHRLAGHCGHVEPKAQKAAEKLLKRHQARLVTGDDTNWDTSARKMGFRLANWDVQANCYTSIHPQAGLDRLSELGYTVIRAI